MNDPTPDSDVIEPLLRQRLQQLAEYAPSTVVYPGEVRLASATPPRAKRRAWFRIGVPLVGLLAAGGVTAIAATGENTGGAATPQEAVEHLMASIEAEDVLGALDTMVPEEVAAFRHSLDDVKSQATRVGLLDEKLSLSGVAGLDISADGLRLVTEDLGDRLAIVRATGGTMTTSIDPATFAFGRPLMDIVGDELKPTTAVIDFSRDSAFLAAVERDGRWYVSLTYSAAEALRRQSSAPLNVPPSRADPAEGFDTPEAVADAFYQRLINLDLTGMTRLMAPGEGDAFARYAPLWIPDADSAVSSARAEGLSLSIAGLRTAATGTGSSRRVDPVEYHISGTTPPTWFNYDSGMPQFDPALPTVIFGPNGGTFIIPVDVAIPETTDGLVPEEYDGSYQVNYLSVDPAGVIDRPVLADPAAEPSAPLTFSIDHVDGCSQVTGTLAERLVDSGYGGNDRTLSSCDSRQGFNAFTALLILGGGLAGIELPPVDVVQMDGTWYLSPIGTVLEQVTQILRSGADGEIGIDSPFAIFLYQTTREGMDATLAGVPADQLPSECSAIVESSSGSYRLMDTFEANLLKPCVTALNGGIASGSVGSAVEETADSILVSTEESTVDATTAASPSAELVEEPASTLVGG